MNIIYFIIIAIVIIMSGFYLFFEFKEANKDFENNEKTQNNKKIYIITQSYILYYSFLYSPYPYINVSDYLKILHQLEIIFSHENNFQFEKAQIDISKNNFLHIFNHETYLYFKKRR